MVSLFLQKRRAYPELCEIHDGPGALLLTPRLDAQTSFAKLFADLGTEKPGVGTPGPQEAGWPTISWSLPLSCFRPPLPCSWAAAMACSCMDLQGLTTLRVVRTSRATYQGKAACWWCEEPLGSYSVRSV